MNVIALPPVTDTLPIAVRAYACRTGQKDDKIKPAKRIAPASEYTLIFDTETTTDAGQALRFAAYQWRKRGELREAGLIYDPEGVAPGELAALKAHAATHDMVLRTRAEFVDTVFYGMAYQLRATVIGFNLPFDISRLAIWHRTARVPREAEAPAMRGGFTFRLSESPYWPHIRIKHLSRKAALISFAGQKQPRDSRGQRRRGLGGGIRRGHFIDVATLAHCLLSRNFTLASLSDFLKVESPKLAFDDFAGPIGPETIAYAVRDVQATWECFAELMARFGALKLSRTIPEKIYSEAGIGKGYLREMGIRPWRECQPDFPPDLIAKVMASYFGGRSEVHIRREVREVMLCDFLSMYPTVCTLMGLWRTVIAKGVTWRDATEDARDMLAQIDLGKLQAPATWRSLATLVRVLPAGDVFPVRARYDGKGPATIGANHLTAEIPQWFTLADCIAAKLLTGKIPRIVEAISFAPGDMQDGLAPIAIAGNPDYRVDPANADFFKRVIELRKAVQAGKKLATGDEWDRLDTAQNSLKICANSTAYGIWVEINVDDPPKPRPVMVYSSTAEPFALASGKIEYPGAYFHPLVATLISGGARLMLAITERLVIDRGLDWAFCDTDAMAIAKPDGLASAEFAGAVQGVVDWFAGLNPYTFGGSILKSEDVNTGLGGDQPVPLFCYAISSKRYALFNLAHDGTPIMRKVSAHGLGHLRDPYPESDAPGDFPPPDKSVLKDGTRRWHCDLWHRIVTAALAGQPDRVRLDYHPALNRPAVSRYAATSPMLLAWYKHYNIGKPYRDQVKPFGFLLSLSPADRLDRSERLHVPKRGRPKKRLPVRPAAPFDSDHAVAVAKAFDRETGEPVPESELAAYADALCQYHISPEGKFLNGDYLDRGTTLRRHIKVAAVRHIGKEADDLERQATLGFDPDSAIEYGEAGGAADMVAALVAALRGFAATAGVAAAARAIGLPRAKVERLLTKGEALLSSRDALALAGKLSAAIDARTGAMQRRDAELAKLRQRVARDGLRETARQIGIDAANLKRRIG